MPSPVAHSLAGAALYLAGSPAERPLAHWRTTLLCVASASAADLDFVVGLAAGDWNRFHQGVSHSLTVALALGFALAWLPLRSLGGWRRGTGPGTCGRTERRTATTAESRTGAWHRG